jgi:hypothetical protein
VNHRPHGAALVLGRHELAVAVAVLQPGQLGLLQLRAPAFVEFGGELVVGTIEGGVGGLKFLVGADVHVVLGVRVGAGVFRGLPLLLRRRGDDKEQAQGGQKAEHNSLHLRLR